MKVISPTELRNEQKKYLDLAEKESIVVKRGNKLIHLVVKDRLITEVTQCHQSVSFTNFVEWKIF